MSSILALDSRETFIAALGWFELGNYVEAFNELDNLPPEHRAGIEVMELRCEIYQKLGKWWDLEIVAQGCSGTGIEHIPFACHHVLSAAFWVLYRYASTHGDGHGGEGSRHQRPID